MIQYRYECMYVADLINRLGPAGRPCFSACMQDQNRTIMRLAVERESLMLDDCSETLGTLIVAEGHFGSLFFLL